jgi:hypothetical protein
MKEKIGKNTNERVADGDSFPAMPLPLEHLSPFHKKLQV